jgi:hypothetical protein
MKLIIENNDFSTQRGYEVFCNGKRLQNKAGGMFPFDFSDDDIYQLLGEKKYSQFQDGKYEFDVPKKQIFAATEDMRFYTPIKQH